MLRLPAIALLVVAPAAARAELIVTMTQQGSDVVMATAGSLNLAGLTRVQLQPVGVAGAGVQPAARTLTTGTPMLPGPSTGGLDDLYTGYTGPAGFGSGGYTEASAGSGDRVWLFGQNLYVPAGYVSNTPLAAVDTFGGQTFASLGVTPGTYRWSWVTSPAGTGGPPTTDGITLTVQAVPEPGVVGLGLSAAVTALAGTLTRRRWAV